MSDIVSVLEYLGITPKQLVPAVVVGVVYLLILRKWFSNDVKAIRTGVEDINLELKVVKDEVRDLHNATKEMQLYLKSDNGFSPQHSLEQKPLFEQYGQHASPMQPNAKGKKLLKDSHFYEAYEQLRENIFQCMDQMNLRTLYDYESGASKALFLLADDPAMDSVKEYAVNNPDQPLDLIFGIASWIIRDDYNRHVQETAQPSPKSPTAAPA